MDNYEYCKQKVDLPGSDLHYSLLFNSPKEKQYMIAIYAFAQEIQALITQLKEPSVQQLKFAWWREQIKELYSGDPQHPIAKALVEPVREFNIPQQLFMEYIDGVELKLTCNHLCSFADLQHYAYREHGIIYAMVAHVLNKQSNSAMPAIQALSLVQTICQSIFQLRSDFLENRVYIPLETLDQFAINQDQLEAMQINEDFHKLLTAQTELANKYFQQALQDAQEINLAQPIRYNKLSLKLLDVIAKEDFPIFKHITKLTPLKKLWTVVWFK